MKKHYYPAVFTKEPDGYSVFFPDLPGCCTEGDTIDQAAEMCVEAIGLYAEDQNKSFSFPAASNPADIETVKGQFVALIEFDELAYRKKHSSKSVSKNLTIPGWLNAMAEEKGVNFSGVLQNALKEQLGIDQQ